MYNVVYVKGDLEDKELLARLIQDVDFVIHCAALAARMANMNNFIKQTLKAHKIIMASLSSNIKKFIYLATPSVHFTNESRKNVRENDELPQNYTNYYAKTKHIADLIVTDAVQKGLPEISLRPSQVFGPYDYTIFGRLLDTNQKRGIPLVNKGQILMDFTYVDNVVDVIISSLKAEDQYIGEFYNITNDQPIYLIDALTLLYSFLNEELHTKKISQRLLSFISSSSQFVANITGKPPI